MKLLTDIFSSKQCKRDTVIIVCTKEDVYQ